MEHSKEILLWLEAPLQAWGHQSRFGRRETLEFPTLSGVVGLIACAQGLADPPAQWLAGWAKSSMNVWCFDRQNSGWITPQLQDYQTVGNGYDDENPWEKLHIPKTIEGKNSVGGGTKITHRFYLQDKAFAVFLSADMALIEEAEQALKNPVWPIYFGRKCCAPTEFVFQGVGDAESLQAHALSLALQKNRSLSFKVRPSLHEDGEFVLNDVPVRLGPNKEYRSRGVVIEKT